MARTTTVRVPPQVFLTDVFAGVDEETLRRLDQQLVGRVEYAVDIDTSREMRLLRALTEPELKPGQKVGWEGLYVGLGLDARWLATVYQLRVRSAPGFVEVFESQGMYNDTHWNHNNNGELVRIRRPALRENAPPVEAYTLGLTAEIGTQAEPPLDHKELRSVSRYGEGGRSDAKVRALAEALAPRIARTFDGERRLALDPVVVPLAAMAASVWAAMKHPAMRRSSGGTRSLRWEGFYACLDALDLGHHERTAARILRRHPQHIGVSTAGLPPRVAPPEWEGSLGVFTTTRDGLLIEHVEHQERLATTPPSIRRGELFGARLQQITAEAEALVAGRRSAARG